MEKSGGAYYNTEINATSLDNINHNTQITLNDISIGGATQSKPG